MDRPDETIVKQNDAYTEAVTALAGIAHSKFRGDAKDALFGHITCTHRVSQRVSFGEAVTGLLQHATNRQLFTIVPNVRAGELLITTDHEGNHTSISLFRNDDWNGTVSIPTGVHRRKRAAETRTLLIERRSIDVTPSLVKAATPWQFCEAIYHHMIGAGFNDRASRVRLDEGKSLWSVFAFSASGPRIFVYTAADRSCTTAALTTELERGNRICPIPGLSIEKCMSIERHRWFMTRGLSNEEMYRVKETMKTPERL